MCPICKCRQKSFIGIPKVSLKAQKVIHHKYNIVKCSKCEIYYVDPVIDFSKEQWNVLYNQDYFPKMSKWYDKNRAKDRNIRFNFLDNFSTSGGKNFLDVGCGEGYCLIEAEKRGWLAHGVDIMDNRINVAKNSSIKFYNSNLIDCYFPDSFFDFVYMDSVLEHLINPMEYLLEIKRILKKGGTIYIGIPNEDSLLNEVRRFIYGIKMSKQTSRLRPFETPYHVVGFNKRSIEFALNLAKFEIKKIRNFACRLEFLRARPFSKEFFKSLLLLPIYLLAVPFNKEVYLEVYVQNK